MNMCLDCIPCFIRQAADTVRLFIVKGQGNFESLSDRARDIFFLFRTKCPVISRHSGFTAGTYVAANWLTRNKTAPAGEAS